MGRNYRMKASISQVRLRSICGHTYTGD